MRDIFLGKPWHWALLLAVSALLWRAGGAKLHVIHFNPFVLALLAGSLAVVLLVVHTTKPGEQVTREPLQDGDAEEPDQQDGGA